MGFPFNYSGEIDYQNRFPVHTQTFQKAFTEKIKTKLENAHATTVLSDQELSFCRGASLKDLFNRDAALLSAVPPGKFILHQTGAISYFLDFKKVNISLTVFILGIFGTVFILGMKDHLLFKIVAILSVWIVFLSFNFINAVSRFKKFVDQALDEMNVGRI